MVARRQLLPAPVFALALLCLPAVATAQACQLLPLEQQLLQPELRTDTPQYAETGYRKQLLRFVNAYYSDIAAELLRGHGDHLTALHRLMGSTDEPQCTGFYREQLLAESNSQDFALALWTLRKAEIAPEQTAGLAPATTTGLAQ